MTGAVALATCLEHPEGSQCEYLFVEALERRGIPAVLAPWNGAQDRFRDASLVLLRGCWDYHRTPAAFLDWIAQLEGAGIRIVNPPEIIRWNFDKAYMLELQAAGLQTPKTAIVDPRDPDQIEKEMHRLDLDRAVLKPVFGQSGNHVTLLEPGRTDVSWAEALDVDRAILQAFEADIAERGEVALIFFDGRFSHAARKSVRPGEWRVNAQYGGGYEAVRVSEAVIEAAEAAIRHAPAAPTYARVDGIVRDDSLLIMELELIEPGLYFDADDDAADRFAGAVTGLLDG